jgi:hypothetical protein
MVRNAKPFEFEDLMAQRVFRPPTRQSFNSISSLMSILMGCGEGGIRTLSTPVESVTYRF